MIIYLHGFGSTGNSKKVTLLQNEFKESVVAPNLPIDPVEVCSLVDKLVKSFYENRKNNEKLIFVGTSLGGFYANYFGQLYDASVVLINPSVSPHRTLTSKLGKNINYATKEEFFVRTGYLEKLETMANTIENNYQGVLVNLFLAKDDEVIPYYIALEKYAFPKTVVVTEDGGHRYDDHWNLVIDRIKELLKN